MVDQVQQLLDILFWALNEVLDDQGITMLQWAFMQRAYMASRGVPFSTVMKATRQSKDQLRRAANFLQGSGLGKVTASPKDGRARIFELNAKGRKQVSQIEQKLEAKLLTLLGAKLLISKRVQEFKWDLFCASGFLPPGDLADLKLYFKQGMVDDTRGFYPEPKLVLPLRNPEEIPF